MTKIMKEERALIGWLAIYNVPIGAGQQKARWNCDKLGKSTPLVKFKMYRRNVQIKEK